LKTFHLHITGQVQGVGFRPFVYVEAEKHQVRGWVKNTIDGVHIRFNAETLEKAQAFSRHIIQNSPRLSIVTGYNIEDARHESFDHFSIIQSDESGEANLMVTPDFAMCEDCRKELWNEKNKRFQYPFITCTNCGPRYSIVTQLPYDRPYTTMYKFMMCEECQKEYNDPTDRRYFSQTNSCPECSVNLSVYDATGTQLKLDLVDQQIDLIVEKLRAGSILAVKGIGGYLIICSADDKYVVQKLRHRKQRPSKAFAMMFPDIDSINQQLIVTQTDEDWLSSPSSPIVLLRRRDQDTDKYAYQEIAPGLDRVGVMIPYTPLYDMILKKYKRAIIATSGNISNEPIIYDNEAALKKLAPIADYIVTNDRDIMVPQDDSVLVHTQTYGQPVLYRRSRGLAPGYLDHRIRWPQKPILAVGGELKSSFTFLFNKNCFISQYLGDLEDYGTQTAFSHTLNHFTGLFRATPELVLHDKHPNYFSTRLAGELAQAYGIPAKAIQHHEAHFAAILGEYKLINVENQVLGIIWDGTGYGNDAQIWGGEIFRYAHNQVTRMAQLEYFDFILGDKMPKEPRISAISVAHRSGYAHELLKAKFTETEWKIYGTILNDDQNLKTSSMGRFFDAVASLVLGIDHCSYEGEAAMFLEARARQYFTENKETIFEPLPGEYFVGLNLDPKLVIDSILIAKLNDTAENTTAFQFHCTLVSWVEKMVEQTGIDAVAFSGGVFQNTLLVDLIIMRMKDRCKLYFHKKMSPNDECISFGQLMYHIHDVESNE
jgi:hydrogenase maturation protein HypF